VVAFIGFTASQTGNLNVESTRQTNGLNLWMKQVNDAGGVKLSDGSVVKFEAKFYDDESNKDPFKNCTHVWLLKTMPPS